MLRHLAFVSLFLWHQALAGESNCPFPNNAPVCPTSGSTILDETYPTQAFVISTRKTDPEHTRGPGPAHQVAAEFVTTILESYQQNQPDIFVPANQEEFEALIKAVKEKLESDGFPEKYIEKKLNAIKHIENKSYTWQQDYFESFFSPLTGRPVARGISSYPDNEESSYYNMPPGWKDKTLNGIKSSGPDCYDVGEPLRDFYPLKPEDMNTIENGKSWGSGEMGGNIEGLPGGLCLKGNNQSEKFVEQYCAPKNNVVEVDVGWLLVGHVDEVIKVVPTIPKKLPEECNFSVWIASPKKGFEDLKKSEFAGQAFIDLKGMDEEQRRQKLHDLIYENNAGNQLCELLKDFKLSGKETEPKKADGAKQATIWKVFNAFLTDKAYAVTTSNTCQEKLEVITNRQMVELMEKDEDFMLTNKLVQETQDKNKQKIKEKLKERLPQCKDIEFVDVPDIFYNKHFAEVDGKKVLPRPGEVGSLFPNPTNSVLVNQTMIVPETPNEALNSSIKQILSQNGLKAKFIDTWNYAHVGNGNMHCSSHSMTYCRPRGSK